MLDCHGAPARDWELLVGLWLNLDRAEARHVLRTYDGIQQSFQRVPDYRVWAARYDDPHEASAMYERELAEAARERHERTHDEPPP